MMGTRAIVHDPAVLAGRWSFAGTTIAVAEVRAAYIADPNQAVRAFRRLGLSRDEVYAAVTFPFPDVRSSSITQDYASVPVHCVCGEETSATIQQTTTNVVTCACDRRWRVTVACELVGGE
jgi:hypothetical protein